MEMMAACGRLPVIQRVGFDQPVGNAGRDQDVAVGNGLNRIDDPLGRGVLEEETRCTFP